MQGPNGGDYKNESVFVEIVRPELTWRMRLDSPPRATSFSGSSSKRTSRTSIDSKQSSRTSDRDASTGQLRIQIERAGPDRLAVGHRPEQLELEPVGILRVEREADAVIRLAHESTMLDEEAARPREIGERAHLPRRVVHAGDVLVGCSQSRLLE